MKEQIMVCVYSFGILSFITIFFILLIISIFIESFLFGNSNSSNSSEFSVKTFKILPFTDSTQENFEQPSSDEYTDPKLDNNALYLSTINASNIAYLKSQLDDILKFKKDVSDIKSQVDSNSTAIQGLNTNLVNTGTSALPDQETTNDLVNSS